MKRVGLVLTGDCERAGLPGAIMRHFPGHAFFTVEGRHDGFTSTGHAIPSFMPQTEDTRIEKLLKTAIGAIGRGGSADFAVIVDDVEVENLGAIANVTNHVRDAATHLASSTKITDRQREALQKRCSFHLLCPMIESWFFANDVAIQSAGVQDLSCNYRSPGNPEHFEVAAANDMAYFAEPSELKKVRKRGFRPWAMDSRASHPKCYLQFLMRDGDKTTYEETIGGVKALEKIDIAKLLANQAEMQFARSLITDLALMLGTCAPTGNVAPETWCPHPNNVLRNF